MTVVIGAVINKTIYLAGDSFCGDEDTAELCRDPKVLNVRHDIGLGLCGDVRTERLVTKAIKSIFSRRKKAVTDVWLKSDFSIQLHNKLKNSGVLRDDKGIHHLEDSQYILAYDGHIYYLDENLALWESQMPYVAIGAGRNHALAALGFAHICGALEENPEEALKNVLELCALHSPWVYPPYTYLEL